MSGRQKRKAKPKAQPVSPFWSRFGPLQYHRPQKDFMGRVVFTMTGYISIRRCGCALMLGRRSDTGRNAMSAQSCTNHVDQVKVVHQMLIDLAPTEPPDHPFRTFQRLLDEEIGAATRV